MELSLEKLELKYDLKIGPTSITDVLSRKSQNL
jgi:hypothetical protein